MFVQNATISNVFVQVAIRYCLRIPQVISDSKNDSRLPGDWRVFCDGNFCYEPNFHPPHQVRLRNGSAVQHFPTGFRCVSPDRRRHRLFLQYRAGSWSGCGADGRCDRGRRQIEDPIVRVPNFSGRFGDRGTSSCHWNDYVHGRAKVSPLDILRHEYGHAYADVNRRRIETKRFEKAFGWPHDIFGSGVREGGVVGGS